jgi:thioredoxin-dependent peroxiredoxin
MLQPGDKVPDLSINDQDGNPVNLAKLKGQKVVLYFYPKDQTPGCTAEACNLRDNYKLLIKQGFEVFGVSTDSEKSHQKFIAKEKLPFRLLADVDRKLHDAFGTWVEKSMYGRKYMGTARVTYLINEKGIIDELIGKVDTKEHANQILKGETTIANAPVYSKAPAKKTAKKTVARKVAPKKSVKKK